MIRIWKGPEMEGNLLGVITLFVCSDIEVSAYRLINHLKSNPDVRRIYFGSGRVPFNGVSYWKLLLKYCKDNDISIVIEHHLLNGNYELLVPYLDNPFTTIIIALYDKKICNIPIQFKTDDYNMVTMYKSYSTTSLDTLNDKNLYANDVLLEEED